MRYSLAAASTILGLAAANPLPANIGLNPGASTNGPDPSTVFVTGITYGGTGCPVGSVGQALSDDKTVFTLLFDSFVAATGPGTGATDNRKNCQINVNLHYPGGWSYSVFQATYRGYAELAPGMTGEQKATYYFSGSTNQASAHSIFNGPMSQDYAVTDTAVAATTVWSPCGAQGMLNINSQVRITGGAPNAKGQLTTDSLDGKFAHILGLQWQKC